MTRPRLDERPDHVRMAVGAGLVQRSVAVSVLMVRVHAAGQDGLDVFQLTVSGDEGSVFRGCVVEG